MLLAMYVVGPLLLPGQSFNTYLFLGAALTATSVGITARVFRDLKQVNAPESQIVLGAAVIDDVLGLIILAVVSAIVTVGMVSVGTLTLIIGKAVLFLVGAIVVGQFAAPYIIRAFSRIHSGVGMKFTIAVSFMLTFAYLAEKIDLAPIVGAFAAGLILDPVQFRDFQTSPLVTDLRNLLKGGTADNGEIQRTLDHHDEKHVNDLIEPVGHFLIPLFFVVTGMSVRLDTLFNGPILFVALGLTIAAIAGKIVTGLAAGKVRKWIVGWGMVPRGEVGLIFATTGLALGAISEDVFSVIVILVMVTTLLPPPILAWLIRKKALSSPERPGEAS
jgi:Kef-type K+ transport system membrane component KefB